MNTEQIFPNTREKCDLQGAPFSDNPSDHVQGLEDRQRLELKAAHSSHSV